ncbi:secretion/DNA translocation related TadE-like protein [Saccharothrix australiensis]|uniref:Secretion/DNA translocation related TadE-like protein n=1 Tax=Saccharothrix australiensis TaxID=2072 RepID=A0A495VS12_9PSEU|nr:secretion/DNA translocation related TadE-like protein [Saccharothrix australiensis]
MAVAVVGVLCSLVVFGVWLGEVVIARHRAAAAADLAAVAAAGWLVDGSSSACGKAAWVAERMESELVACDVSGWEVVVEVRGPGSVVGAPSARARAGAGEG